MNRPEAIRLAGISVAGMAVCCTLTTLVVTGAIAVGVARLGGSVGLAIVAGLLAAMVISSRRRRLHECCDTKSPVQGQRPRTDRIER